jgi:hypothetical protein
MDMRFKLREKNVQGQLIGAHSDYGTKNVPVYERGSIVESTEKLHLLFPDKFELLEEEEKPAKGAKKAKQEPGPVKEEEKREKLPGEPGGPVDASHHFGKAGTADVLVFQYDDDSYNVFDPGNVKTPLNKEGRLPDKKAVNKFLKTLLESPTDEE